MSNQQFEERSQVRRNLTVRDKPGVPTAPDTLRWKLDCVTTQTPSLDWRSGDPVPVQEIIIPASANVIVNNANAVETKRVSVQANFGTDGQLNAKSDYDVLNNEFYT